MFYLIGALFFPRGVDGVTVGSYVVALLFCFMHYILLCGRLARNQGYWVCRLPALPLKLLHRFVGLARLRELSLSRFFLLSRVWISLSSAYNVAVPVANERRRDCV